MSEANKNYLVYCHTSPSGKKYIGRTDSIRRRWNPSQYKNCPIFYEAIQKYGWKNFKHEVLLDGLTRAESDEWEQYYIALYKTDCRGYGYNFSKGGTGGNQKPTTIVSQYDLEGNYIATFSSAAEAARSVDLERGAARRERVSWCCKHGGVGFGFQWRYDDSQDKLEPYRRASQYSVAQYDITGHKIREYVSVASAAQILANMYPQYSLRSISSAVFRGVRYQRPTFLNCWWMCGDSTPDTILTPHIKTQKGTHVFQYALDGKLIARYDSLQEASEQTPLHYATFAKKTQTGVYTDGIFIWSRKELDATYGGDSAKSAGMCA